MHETGYNDIISPNVIYTLLVNAIIYIANTRFRYNNFQSSNNDLDIRYIKMKISLTVPLSDLENPK